VTSDGVSSSPRVGGCQPRQRHSLETNLDADQCRVLDLGLHVIKVSPKPVPNIRRSSSRPMRTLQTLGFKPFPAPQAIRADGTALLSKEVLYSVSSGNKKAPFAAASSS
jgi:hypothetical protein